MTNKILFLILLSFIYVFAVAQTHDEQHEHEHEHEHSHVHELGFSVAPAMFLSEDEISMAVHLHYVYNFTDTKFGLGLGYERIFDEHKHNFIGVELVYRPLHALTLDLSPGIAFEGEHKDEVDFALHFEIVYEFEFGAFHIGPMTEIAYHPEDWHFSLGVHVGFGF